MKNTSFHKHIHHHSKRFTIKCRECSKNKLNFYMKVNGDVINTCYIPTTYEILKDRLPNVLKTACFNDMNLPFSEEVKRTEIGHLFEHILLEYLCAHHDHKKSKCVEFSGKTAWNWKKDPKGTFHINVQGEDIDIEAVKKAFNMSVLLTEYIMSEGNVNKRVAQII
ncbi:MAG: hypothetical protein U0525_02615 [Patescibacteria group bacterium]